jgi:5-methylcytosine-specific restriction endonuclease McrA
MNKLKLIRPTKKRNSHGSIIWECKCSCGNISFHVGWQVRNGQIKSCGCGRRSKNPERSVLSAIYQDYKYNSKKRGIKFELDFELFKNIIKNECYYCGTKPSKTQRNTKIKAPSIVLVNGIDRKNNNLGYIEENVVACCKICNGAKKDLMYDDWLIWLDRVGKRYATNR